MEKALKQNQTSVGEEHLLGKKRRNRRRFHEINKDNDIRYRGPLSYRHLRIIGWIAFALSQIGIGFRIATIADPNLAASLVGWMSFFGLFTNLMMPLFLIANFAIILNAKDGYRKLIIQYSFLTVLFYGVFIYIHQHYLVGLMMSFGKIDRGSANEAVNLIISLASGNGFMTFNVFIDLLLCTLLSFFLLYTPKEHFKGKYKIIFRLFALLPIFYEITSIVLKMCASIINTFTIPVYVYPLLTTKPPVTFLVFIALVLFIKFREKIFIKRGGTRAQYKEFLKTNTNSLHFSIFSSIAFAIGFVLDFILLIAFAIAITPFMAGETIDSQVLLAFREVGSWGFGQSIIFIILIPIIMLFSYTRVHENGLIDTFIPLGGIGLTIFVYIESAYWLLKTMPNIIHDLISKITGG